MNIATTPNINSRIDIPANIQTPCANKNSSLEPKPNNSQPKEVETSTAVEDTKTNLSDQYQATIEWIASRGSVTRALLDFFGDEVPSLLAQSTRNIYSFAEATFQAGINLASIFVFPYTASIMGKISSSLFLNSTEQKNFKHYMLFNIHELDDKEELDNAVNRIKVKEIEDSYFMENFLGKTDRNIDLRNKKINSIEKFIGTLNFDDEKVKRVKSFKKSILILQSFIESGVWGGLYLFNRLFRKYVLGQDRFTGTIAYASNKQSKQLGDSQGLGLWQKLGFLTAFLSGPLLNIFALNKFEDKKLLAKSPWLSNLRKEWDMEHGTYPKLGLMYSYSLIPQVLSCISGSQGRNELIENLMTYSGTIISWLVGTQVTTGLLAQRADKALADKFNVDRGILVEQRHLHSPLPDPAKLDHIFGKTKGNDELEFAARKEHTKVFSQGSLLHSGMMFVMQLAINQITKYRVQRQLQNIKTVAA